MAELDARKAQKLSTTAKTLQRQIKTNNICDDCTRSQPDLELNYWDFSRKSTTDDCFLGLTLAVNPSVSNIGNKLYLFSNIYKFHIKFW